MRLSRGKLDHERQPGPSLDTDSALRAGYDKPGSFTRIPLSMVGCTVLERNARANMGWASQTARLPCLMAQVSHPVRCELLRSREFSAEYIADDNMREAGRRRA
jgi:hypothetical protein